MLRSSISTSRVRAPVTARRYKLTVYMNAAGSRRVIQMQRLGLGRLLRSWANPGPWTGAPTSGHGMATQASVTSTPASGPAASASPHTGGGARVVVLGGGFGGLYAAIRLDQLMWPRGKKPQVTLVDQSDRFVFKPLLYELINGTATQEEVAPSLAQLLAPYPVRLVQAQVTGVHPNAAAAVYDAAGHVALSDGTSLPYDYLLVALGSQPDSRGVPGVREWAVPFNTYDDAVRVKGTLDLLADSGAGGSVVVVGGGYAGVELAAMVGERLLGRGGGGGGASLAVRLLTPGSDILEESPAGQRAAANKALAELGVEVVTGVRVEALGAPDANASSLTALPTACTVIYSPVTVAAAAAAAASGADMPPPSSWSPPPPPPKQQQQQQLAADLVIWTAGSSPATGGRLDFPTNARGAIETEPSLRVRGSNAIFALGDVAVAAAAADPSPSSQSSAQAQPQVLPATAQVAFQQADYVAWNIWAAINGRPLLPFRYQHLGSMMSLGQINAAVALPLELPPSLTDAVRSSPLGPLLNAAGVRLGDGTSASAAGAAAGGVTLEGPLAAVLRRGAYLYRQPTNEQRINVAASWLRMGLEAAAALGGGRWAGRY